jgi:hypothetical protein
MGYIPALATLPARMTRPQISLAHVHMQDSVPAKIRFVHAGNVFEFVLMDGSNMETGAYFNQFLEHIGHTQRIFNIEDEEWVWEKETGVFIFADKVRFPEILQQLNHGDGLDIKAQMPPPPTKNEILRGWCEMCISCNRHDNYARLDDYSDTLIEYYKADTQEAIYPTTQVLIAEAISLKARYLRQLGDRKRERECHEFIIEHFGAHPALPVTIGKAWNELGYILLRDAKSAWNPQESFASDVKNESQKLLLQAQAALETAHEKMPKYGVVLGNLAYVLWLSDKAGDAETTLRRAFSMPIKSGKPLFEAICSDIATNPIPPDAGFKELLQRVWQETGAFP